jgi:hypothetical protein
LRLAASWFSALATRAVALLNALRAASAVLRVLRASLAAFFASFFAFLNMSFRRADYFSAAAAARWGAFC